MDIGDIVVKGGEDQLFTARSFRLNKKGISLILGPNGSGKTSFLRQLSRLILDGKLLCRNDVGYISPMSAYDRSIPIEGESLIDLYEGILEWPRTFEIHFGHLKRKSIREMSSGEFQSLILISQLCSKRKVYLFDEPFSHLNPTWTRIFIDFIENLSSESAFLIICHHIEDYKGVNVKRLSISNGQLEYH